MLKGEINNNLETYRFQAGRSVVTVHAANMEEAEIVAETKLNERSAKFFATPPVGGWKLQRLESV